jgi:hypothetical protein
MIMGGPTVGLSPFLGRFSILTPWIALLGRLVWVHMLPHLWHLPSATRFRRCSLCRMRTRARRRRLLWTHLWLLRSVSVLLRCPSRLYRRPLRVSFLSIQFQWLRRCSRPLLRVLSMLRCQSLWRLRRLDWFHLSSLRSWRHRSPLGLSFSRSIQSRIRVFP